MREIDADTEALVSLRVNGREVSARAESRMQLADFLRHRLGLYGTHVGCEHGVCGACTVVVDGRAVRSCLMLAVQAEGSDVQTVEGLATNGQPAELQRAFARHHALQCGFCTPGILMSATRFLEEHGNPDEREVRQMLTGHLCRCTGYHSIVAAILDCARSSGDRPTQPDTDSGNPREGGDAGAGNN